MALSLVWALLTFINPSTSIDNIITWSTGGCGPDLGSDPSEPTFYDDQNLSYAFGEEPMKDWDLKRREWLKLHPSFAASEEKVLLVTGSQPNVCKNPVGDHLQLRLFKNKVDYCRIHGHEIFYNNVLLNQKGTGFWAKYPLLRASMLAHPEAEWIWWVDSDAVLTDMEFKLPLERYKDHNLVVHGWWNMLYEEKSWTSLNAGQGISGSDDQSALIYLLIKEKDRWADRIYLESEYNLHGYWLGIVDGLDKIGEGYMEIDRAVDLLRRRHAEKMSLFYGAMREKHMKDRGFWKENVRRPFVTHFTGCEPCSGEHNSMYTWEACWNGMQKALNIADNQVLSRFGFVHPDLLNSSLVSPLPFDFPA
ncbi:putative glycosyltransferase 7 [Prunus yedoensis var. nudiflora]|uniref:Putative glycosyltransferase 7 n=1 Tax=Prunus yedoensis var. nudiflora TaxID=2094558 RepID=A0A314UUC5_PRUYE|nr:putative glycosyltransferase 7 [Prunus yedoensis var. nudiflora]